MTNAIVTFALGAFALLGLIFALQIFFYTRDLRALQVHAFEAQAGLMRVQQLQAVVIDATAFNQKSPNPELTRILQMTQTKPAATK